MTWPLRDVDVGTSLYGPTPLSPPHRALCLAPRRSTKIWPAVKLLLGLEGALGQGAFSEPGIDWRAFFFSRGRPARFAGLDASLTPLSRATPRKRPV